MTKFMPSRVKSKQAAFTLLEIAITITIVGLLIGGLAIGSNVIRTAQISSISSDLNKIYTATNMFRTKYSGLPGDLKNATTYWGAQADDGNTENCFDTPSTGTATCNGNGDGKIDKGYSTTTAAERARFWQHLANANLIEGHYTGFHGKTTPMEEFRVGGLNVMASHLTGTHYNVSNVTITVGNTDYFPLPNTNIIELTRDFPQQPEPPRTILEATEAQTLDTKMDDGMPATGVVVGPKSTNQYTSPPLSSIPCTTDTTITAKYNVAQSGKICFVWFLFK